MKKLILGLALFPLFSFGVGTVTVTRSALLDVRGLFKVGEKVSVAWVADAADGSVPATAIDVRGYVTKVVTNPGAVAPTANYDIALGDPDDSALDVLGGALANRHTSTTEQVYPLITGAQVPVFVHGAGSLTISNNAVNSATGDIHFYLHN